MKKKYIFIFFACAAYIFFLVNTTKVDLILFTKNSILFTGISCLLTYFTLETFYPLVKISQKILSILATWSIAHMYFLLSTSLFSNNTSAFVLTSTIILLVTTSVYIQKHYHHSHHFTKKDTLDKNIQEKIGELQKNYQKTRKLLLEQTEYMSFAAHELKQPISLLMLQFETQLLNNHHDPQTQEDLMVIEAALVQLKKLMNSLFDTQKFEMGKMNLHKEKTSLHEYLNTLNYQITTLMKNHNIHYQFTNIENKKALVNIDTNRITQVFYNLVNNAIRFTKPFGTITFHVKEEEEVINFYLYDNGEGIPKKNQKNLFKKFHQGETQSGMGLGLYICKEIINLHQGEIEYMSNSPKGSVFKVRIPILKEEHYSKIYPCPLTVLKRG